MRLPSTATRSARSSVFCLLASTMLCASGTAFAQPPATTAADDDDDGTIVITAQKREENLQDVPIAVTALGTETLDQLQVDNFADYARLVPSLSSNSLGPGFSQVYFRGVASGENANHSASLPSVGTYLDEQPITTTTGALDIHVFDIARIEALAGPQGTLYGASSQAGTVRIITNRPDTSGFYGEANLELNQVSHGGFGGTLEAFVNAPLSDRAAFRLVGWYRHDAGYIDNIPGTLVFPSLEAEQGTAAATFTNAPFVDDDYNDVDTYGARAALRIELNDNWTITPQVMGQVQRSNGSFAQESGLDEYQVQQFNDEFQHDRWIQGALTIEGQIGNFDLTYAGAYLLRQNDGAFDYVDYAYFYDAISGYGAYFTDNNGALVNPNQYVESDDSFTKQSHELRVASPADRPVRLVGGLFYQRQTHNIEQNYIVDDIADSITVPGTESNIWLTKQLRVDRDYAIFGEVAWDILPQLTLTGGGRFYRFDNSLIGFFGFNNPGYSSNPDYLCLGPPVVDGSPCTDLGVLGPDGDIRPKRIRDTGFLHRLNLTYRITDDALVYATWSRGFRPGGINRRSSIPPYDPDFITNYEFGWKTQWLDNRLTLNGAIYQLDWTDIQLSFLGANGLTEIRNAGNARIRGIEAELSARPAPGLTFGIAGAFNDAQLTEDFCLFANDSFDCTLPGPDTDGDGLPDANDVLAPSGTRLPLTARFKGNLRARYEFPVMGMEGHVQVAAAYEGRRRRDVRLVERDIYGDLDAFTTVDLTAGIRNDRWSLELFARNLFDENGALGSFIQCNETTCGDPDGLTAIGPKVYTIVSRPRTIGIRLGTRF